MSKVKLEPMVFTFDGVDVIITPVVKNKWFKETVTFEINYDKDDLALVGVSEDALKAKIQTFMRES